MTDTDIRYHGISIKSLWIKQWETTPLLASRKLMTMHKPNITDNGMKDVKFRFRFRNDRKENGFNVTQQMTK